jgi:hypothetical protein
VFSWQTQTYGRIEYAHDVEQEELCSRAAAGALMVRLNAQYSYSVQTKTAPVGDARVQ